MDAAIERARWWSWRRQRLDRTCRGVEDCLRSVVGVYSSNPQGPLSLLTRVPRLMKGAAVEGVISTKRAVRIPAMRRSVFMVPTDNADRILAATRLPERTWWWVLGRAGIGERAYDTLKARILEVATSPKTIDEIRAELPRAPRILGEVLRSICAQGDLLGIHSSSIRSNDLTYAATEVWLGRRFEALHQDQALAWLAGEYLSAFGPATVEDYAWWTGQPEDRARAALEAHETVDLGEGLLLHARDLKAFEGLRPMTGRVNLLPKWDCYTMGYAPEGRARFADPDVLDLAYDAGGDARPVVLVEGAVGGTWSLRLTKTRARITLSMFQRPGSKLRAALEDEARMVGTFLEAARADIEVERVSKRAARATGRPGATRKKEPATKKGAARGGSSRPKKATRRPRRSSRR